MKAFTFRLQTKLDLVSWEKKMAREEMRKAQIAYDLEMDILTHLENRMEEVNHSLRSRRGTILRIDEIILLKDFQQALKKRINFQRDNVDNAEKKLESTRQALMEKTKELKSLEKLKERRFREYMREMGREEQALIDETAANYRAEDEVEG